MIEGSFFEEGIFVGGGRVIKLLVGLVEKIVELVEFCIGKDFYFEFCFLGGIISRRVLRRKFF